MTDKKILIEIDESLARELLECGGVGYSEGVGGDIGSILLKIKATFPKLAAEYLWLPWEDYKP